MKKVTRLQESRNKFKRRRKQILKNKKLIRLNVANKTIKTVAITGSILFGLFVIGVSLIKITYKELGNIEFGQLTQD
jgi:hypothetical protein